MQRTRRIQPTMQTNDLHISQERFNTFSQVMNRALLASRMGTSTYDGNRDLYQALGYPKRLDFINHYLPKYLRHDLAKAIIDRPVRAGVS